MTSTMATLPRQSAAAPDVPLVSVLVQTDGGGESTWAELSGAAEEIGWPLDAIERLEGLGLLRMMPGQAVNWTAWRALCLRLSHVPGIHAVACIGLDGGAEGYALFRGGRMVALRSLEWSADETWLRLAEDHETPPEALARHLSAHGPLGELARHLGLDGREALGVGPGTGGCGHGHAGHGPAGHATGADDRPETKPGLRAVPEASPNETEAGPDPDAAVLDEATTPPFVPGRSATRTAGALTLAALLLVVALWLLYALEG